MNTKELLNKFREYLILENKSKNTIIGYISSLKQLEDVLDITSLTQEKVNEFFVNLEGNVNTINQRKKALIKLLEYLKLDINIPKFKQAENPLPEYFSEDYFLDEIIPSIEILFRDDIKIRYLFYLMFYTGLRVGEIANLRKEDFDLEKYCIKIQKRKAKNPILVYYPKDMVDIIQLYFDMYPEQEEAINVQERGIGKYCEKLSRNLNRHISPHTFRHSFAITYLKKGGTATNLQKLLGHKSATATAIYMQMTDFDRENEYRNIMKIRKQSNKK